MQQDSVKDKEKAEREKAFILGRPATAAGGGKKEEPKKKVKECSFCKGKNHTEKFCWKRYPSKAPPGCRDKEKEELIKKYEWAREVVRATEKIGLGFGKQEELVRLRIEKRLDKRCMSM